MSKPSYRELKRFDAQYAHQHSYQSDKIRKLRLRWIVSDLKQRGFQVEKSESFYSSASSYVSLLISPKTVKSIMEYWEVRIGVNYGALSVTKSFEAETYRINNAINEKMNEKFDLAYNMKHHSEPAYVRGNAYAYAYAPTVWVE